MELFAGIGGFGLAGEWAGIESTVQVEWNPFCQKVLAKNFPNAQRFGDITNFDGTPFRGTIDIVSGGFPCQPYSTAGKRLGKEDERHLWPEMLRVIREVAPSWVVGENVRGIVSWDGGVVFNEVQADLEAEGYEVQAFILPACGVDAPHKRERVWFIAHAAQTNDSRGAGEVSGKNGGQKQHNIPEFGGASALHGLSANAEQFRQSRQGRAAEGCLCETPHGNWQASWSYDDGRWPIESAVCGGDDGFSEGLDENIEERLSALGNAIVPQVAFQIFKSIVAYETL